MNRFAVLLALLLAACATPAPRAPATPGMDDSRDGGGRATPGAVAGEVERRQERPPESVPAAPPKATAPPPAAPDVPRTALPAPAIPAAPSAPVFREFVAHNDEKLLEVFPGMHKSELIRTMHAEAGRWHNPYRHEMLLDRAGKAYEVFYYLMRDPEGKPVKDRHLTPVIVQQDTVVAIGAYRLKKLKRGESIDLPRRPPPRAS